MAYPAIWKTNTNISSKSLLNEFERALNGKLSVVYPDNVDWTGITVLGKGAVDHLSELPALNDFIFQLGRKNVLGATYFNLSPNSTLHRHRDMNGNLLFGVIRLHIPLQTNPKAIMEVQRKRYHLPLDTVWALDTSGLHALENTGQENRIHLVIDVKRGAETAIYFPRFTVALAYHMVFFCCIVCWKILRDLITKPKSLMKRVRTLGEKTVNR